MLRLEPDDLEFDGVHYRWDATSGQSQKSDPRQLVSPTASPPASVAAVPSQSPEPMRTGRGVVVGFCHKPVVHIALIREAPVAGDEGSGPAGIQMFKAKMALNGHRRPNPSMTNTPFSFVADFPVEDLGRLEDSKALAEYLLKALDRGTVSKCVSLAMKLEGNARLSLSYMTNGDVVVLLVVPRRVTKKKGFKRPLGHHQLSRSAGGGAP